MSGSPSRRMRREEQRRTLREKPPRSEDAWADVLKTFGGEIGAVAMLLAEEYPELRDDAAAERLVAAARRLSVAMGEDGLSAGLWGALCFLDREGFLSIDRLLRELPELPEVDESKKLPF